MSYTDFIALLPILTVAASSILALLMTAFRRHHGSVVFISAAGLVAAFFTLWNSYTVVPHQTHLLIVDVYALFFMGLILAATVVVVFLAHGYLRRLEEHKEEFYVVLLLATLGAMVMVVSNHFAAFFLGLELLTVSLYVMIAYLRRRAHALEAGVKYLILAAASSAFLLFGMALIYAEMGTIHFTEMTERLNSTMEISTVFLLTGLSMMMVGIGFKLAVVPFHMWTPDIYEGAPAPVTAYVATVSKGAMFALLLRYFIDIQGYAYAGIMVIFSVIAVASMFLGNFLALLQNNVKRILAYSSIAHLGYLLVAFIAGGELAVEAIIFYLVAYFVTTLSAFGIVSMLSKRGSELVALEDYRGLFWSHPVLAAVFTAALLSLAGIPLTSGFIGKYFVIAAGVNSAQWALVVILVINSAIGLYYYLRIVVVMLSPLPQPEVEQRRVSWTGLLTLGFLGLALLWLGISPSPLINLIQATVAMFFL